jgi:hypothetical protein
MSMSNRVIVCSRRRKKSPICTRRCVMRIRGFGPLDAAGWHAHSATHVGLHRVQIERIIERLRAASPPERAAAVRN